MQYMRCSVCYKRLIWKFFYVLAEVNVIQPHVAHMLQFVEHIAVEDDQSDGVIAASCGLIGYV